MTLAARLTAQSDTESQRVHELQRKLAAARAERASLQGYTHAVEAERDGLQQALDRLAALGEVTPGKARSLSRRTSKGRAVAVVHYSDWHVGELVEKAKTNGRNAYNPEVCRARVGKLAQSTIRLLRLMRQIWQIDQMLLVLGGDFVTGYLHEELAQTNTMGPMEEARFATELLGVALNTLAEHGELKRISVVCHRGNHARLTRKIQFKNDFETSLETLIYWNLSQQFSGKPFEWNIPQSDITYTELTPGHVIRTCHGHQIKYAGGIGGISVPLTRWVVRADQTQKADLTMLGHFHTYQPAASFDINGSLKGWDEFSQSHGFAYEPPSQSWLLFDTHRQLITTRNPIFCE